MAVFNKCVASFANVVCVACTLLPTNVCSNLHKVPFSLVNHNDPPEKCVCVCGGRRGGGEGSHF